MLGVFCYLLGFKVDCIWEIFIYENSSWRGGGMCKLFFLEILVCFVFFDENFLKVDIQSEGFWCFFFQVNCFGKLDCVVVVVIFDMVGEFILELFIGI